MGAILTPDQQAFYFGMDGKYDMGVPKGRIIEGNMELSAEKLNATGYKCAVDSDYEYDEEGSQENAGEASEQEGGIKDFNVKEYAKENKKVLIGIGIVLAVLIFLGK